MAGRPKAKARLQSERAKQRAKGRFTDAEKRVVLARAETVGPKLAAEEAGVSPATLRTWRRRLPAVSEEPVTAGVTSSPGTDSPTSAVSLRAAADREREAMSKALDQADKLLACSMASEARNASVVAGVRADRARELEDSARAAELHEVELSKGVGELVVAAIERGFDDLALPIPRVFVRALLGGWPAPVEEEVVHAAREQVRRAIRSELAAEVEAVGQEQRALPAGDESEQPVDGVIVEESEQIEGSPSISAEPQVEDAVVVEEVGADGLPPGVELAPLGEVTDTFRVIYPDPEVARRNFTLFRHAQSDAAKAEVAAKRQAVADLIEAERLAAEEAATQERIQKRDAARREARDRKERELPRMAKRESPSRGPW